jgi:hypothetical protein
MDAPNLLSKYVYSYRTITEPPGLPRWFSPILCQHITQHYQYLELSIECAFRANLTNQNPEGTGLHLNLGRVSRCCIRLAYTKSHELHYCVTSHVFARLVNSQDTVFYEDRPM